MKKWFLIAIVSLLVLILGLFSPAHTPTVQAKKVGTTPTWAKAFGGSSGDVATSLAPTSDGGAIVAGFSASFSGNGGNTPWVLRLSADGRVQWQKSYGRNIYGYVRAITASSDGNYILAGSTSPNPFGVPDVWVFKIDPAGNLLWQKAFGGPSYEEANGVAATPDGGAVLAGYTESFSPGARHVLVVRVDGSGNIAWSETIGSGTQDFANAITATADGGYVLVGGTNAEFAQNGDMLVIKVDASGQIVWRQYLGDAGYDVANAVQQTPDGGYILAGFTDSNAGGNGDVAVIKLSPLGWEEWGKALGGASGDGANSILVTPDQGYVVAGFTSSFGAGGQDFWIVRLNGDGSDRWQKAYGGGSDDVANAVVATSDGDFMVAGHTASFGAGSDDAWVIKLGQDGVVSDNCTGCYPTFAPNSFLGGGERIYPGSALSQPLTVRTTAAAAADTAGQVSTQCSSESLNVSIDIAPGSATHAINLSTRKLIPVAVLSSSALDARSIKPGSVRFGPKGAELVRSEYRDVNGDGQVDLVLYFSTSRTGLKPRDTQACLTGQTRDGRTIDGCGAITLLP